MNNDIVIPRQLRLDYIMDLATARARGNYGWQ